VNLRPIGEEKMARGTQVSKMGKRKRVGTWGTKAKKKARPYNPMRGISVRKSDFGFPDTLTTKVKYADIFNVTGVSGTLGNAVFQLNSLFDPDLTGAGHQPMYFDQLCGAAGSAPYARYRVKGASIKVTYSMVSPPSLTATNVGPVLVGVITQRANSLLASNTSGIMETNNTDFKLLGDKGSGTSSVTVYRRFNPKIDLAVDPEDDTLSAAYNASPSLGWFAHCVKIDDTGTSTVRAFVEIVFDVVFFGRNEVTQS